MSWHWLGPGRTPFAAPGAGAPTMTSIIFWMASRVAALSAAVGVPLPPRALTTLSSVGFVHSARRTYSISPILAVKPPLARQSAAALAAAAMSSGVSPCLGGAVRPLKIRGELKVPLAHPEQAAIVSSPRIFSGLTAPPRHGEAPEDIAAAAKEAADWRAKGGFTAKMGEMEYVLPAEGTNPMLDSVVKARGGTPGGKPTAADSAGVRAAIQKIMDDMMAPPPGTVNGVRPGPSQCHDITVYPAMGLAGGACGGYGLLLDIRDAANPKRIDAVSDSNFSYWHSATFNNDGTKLLFSDEWGGGGQPKCRATDKHEWGADAIFTLADNRLKFQSYYKMSAPQTPFENCVAHNGSLIPIPGRDVMVQAWYQGGISVFDWTDPAHPQEIAFFDRGPVDSTKMEDGGSWSAYWYNGVIVSSEISRGLDIFELTPSGFISQNEIDAAKLVQLEYLNTQDQPKFVWPASFTVARAFLDQVARSNGLAPERLAATRTALARAERLSGVQRREALLQLATQLDGDAQGAPGRLRTLAAEVRDLAGVGAGAGADR